MLQKTCLALATLVLCTSKILGVLPSVDPDLLEFLESLERFKTSSALEVSALGGTCSDSSAKAGAGRKVTLEFSEERLGLSAGCDGVAIINGGDGPASRCGRLLGGGLMISSSAASPDVIDVRVSTMPSKVNDRTESFFPRFSLGSLLASKQLTLAKWQSVQCEKNVLHTSWIAQLVDWAMTCLSVLCLPLFLLLSPFSLSLPQQLSFPPSIPQILEPLVPDVTEQRLLWWACMITSTMFNSKHPMASITYSCTLISWYGHALPAGPGSGKSTRPRPASLEISAGPYAWPHKWQQMATEKPRVAPSQRFPLTWATATGNTRIHTNPSEGAGKPSNSFKPTHCKKSSRRCKTINSNDVGTDTFNLKS